VGQQTRLATKAKTALAWNHTKSLNRVLRLPAIFAGNSSSFRHMFRLME